VARTTAAAHSPYARSGALARGRVNFVNLGPVGAGYRRAQARNFFALGVRTFEPFDACVARFQGVKVTKVTVPCTARLNSRGKCILCILSPPLAGSGRYRGGTVGGGGAVGTVVNGGTADGTGGSGSSPRSISAQGLSLRPGPAPPQRRKPFVSMWKR